MLWCPTTNFFTLLEPRVWWWIWLRKPMCKYSSYLVFHQLIVYHRNRTDELDAYMTVLYIMLSSCYYDHVLMDNNQRQYMWKSSCNDYPWCWHILFSPRSSWTLDPYPFRYYKTHLIQLSNEEGKNPCYVAMTSIIHLLLKILALVHMLLLIIFGTTDDAATMKQQIKGLWKSKSCNTSGTYYMSLFGWIETNVPYQS